MLNWTHDVPTDPRGVSLPILRTPAKRPLQAIVTSTDLIGCYTHFWHGSTVPCTLPECEPHKDGLPFRWHAYMSAVDVFNHLHFIFEVTALAAKPFVAFRDVHGTTRGCQFLAKRWNNRPNARIIIQTKAVDLTQIHIPEPPDVRKCMAIIWSLPDQNVVASRHHPENQMTQIDSTPPPPDLK